MLGLCAFIDAHEQAVRRDLLEFGYRLDAVGTAGGMAWVDLLAFVAEAPQGSAIFRASLDEPEDADWSTANQLLAAVADGIAVLAWQNSGGKRGDKPKPIERPGHRPEKRVYKGDVMSIEEMSEKLGMPLLF